MIFKLFIDKNCQEEIVANVHARTPLICEIERLVQQDSQPDQIAGYIDDEIKMLEISGIECFTVENEKTYAVYQNCKRYLIRKRLYELEQILPDHFERISKSAIANWKKISKFKVQLSGAVDAVFQTGYVECISRRCYSDLKRRYGL
ncbi:MAG: LytTR family transcriptional regulator [Oscillospiraceae bacterium]|nr:LytTR family transcriptional regulator [Oscillospiraceae bacterium]